MSPNEKIIFLQNQINVLQAELEEIKEQIEDEPRPANRYSMSDFLQWIVKLEKNWHIESSLT